MKKTFQQKNKGPASRRQANASRGGFTRTPKFGVTPKGGGFTLVETLVAVSIFSISILGLLVVLTQGIADTGYAKKKIMAGYLAQEGIEYVRNMRDTYVIYDAVSPQNGWNTFIVANKAYDIPSTDPNFTGLTRTITMTSVSLNEVKISSTVSWTQGSGARSVTFSENLYNWIE